MALQTVEQMGYASPATMRLVISRFRDQGLPQPLTPETILRVGVQESLAPRTIQTLKLLGLIDEEGMFTEQFERLRRVPTADFKGELLSVLRSAYAPVFDVLEPDGASYLQVQDAFRTFKPEGQRDRMVALFLGLLDYAEYSENLPTGRGARSAQNAAAPGPTAPRPKNKPSERKSNVKRQQPPNPPSPGRTEPGQRFEVQFGSVGTFVGYVDVRWMDLPKETLIALHDHIDAIKALGYGDSASPSVNAVEDEPTEEAVS